MKRRLASHERLTTLTLSAELATTLVTVCRKFSAPECGKPGEEDAPASGKLPGIQADPRVLAECAEFDVRIIEKTRYPEAVETRAGNAIRSILNKRGDGRVRLG